MDIVDITKEMYKLYSTKCDPVVSMVHWASGYYAGLLKENNFPLTDGEHWDCDKVVYCGKDFIETSWEYTWQYGGHSKGHCEIPVQAIIGDEKTRKSYIQNLVNKKVQARDGKVKSEADEKKILRKEMFNRLKEEFEGETE